MLSVRLAPRRFRFRSPPAACCRSTSEGEKEGMGKRSRECDRQRKHLYVALDDWGKGFSLHKIDVESDQGQLRLAEPAAQRIESTRYSVSLAAVGSEILITAKAEAEADCEPSMMFIYDAETAALSMGPRLPSKLLQGFDMAVPVAGKLYVLASHLERLSVKILALPPTSSSRLLDPSPWITIPARPPFRRGEFVCSYALHPDGHTIFMTTARFSGKKRTYSFVMRATADTKPSLGQPDCSVLNLTVFSLRCNEEGEPQAVIHRTHSYPVTLHLDLFPIEAFWM